MSVADRTQQGASVESDKQALQNGITGVELWLRKVKHERDQEKDWRKQGQEAVNTFEANAESTTKFNVFHSNIETLVPAVYNSTPTPDVRRRFADKDPIARLGAEAIERVITATNDRYDVDEVIFGAVQDAVLPGRGAARVRYEVTTEDVSFTDPDTGEQVTGEKVVDQKVWSEGVPWDRIILGPATSWDEMPWMAFYHDMTRDDVEELIKGQGVPEKYGSLEGYMQYLGFSADGTATKESDKPTTENGAGVYHTIPVFEIHDKREKRILWLTDRDDQNALKVEGDRLKLSGFFPMPAPIQQVRRANSLKAVCPYNVYKDLLSEINDTTARIKKITKSLRVRSVADPILQNILSALEMADDGQVVTAKLPDNTAAEAVREGFTGKGFKLADLIHQLPMDDAVQTLAQLYQQREQAKQALYEVSGLSDILRGSTQASETATAQDIKARWGAQRIQRLTSEVQRFARDLFRLKAEIAMTFFDWEFIKEITNLDFEIKPAAMGHNGGPPLEEDDEQGQIDPADVEAEIRQLFESKARLYRIDIETDSTIRADTQRNQEQMNAFLQGVAQFVQAIGALKQSAPELAGPFIEMFANTFPRQFNLPKSAQDALERLSEIGQQGMQQEEDPRIAELTQMVEGLQAELQTAQQAANDKQADREHQLALKDREIAAAKAQKHADLEYQMQRDERQAAFQERELSDRMRNTEVAVSRLAIDDKRAAMPFHLENMKQDFEANERAKDREVRLLEVASKERLDREKIKKAAANNNSRKQRENA